MSWLKRVVEWCRGTEHLKGLTQEEYEEYEMLWEIYEWRGLTSAEHERLNELQEKRVQYDRS